MGSGPARDHYQSGTWMEHKSKPTSRSSLTPPLLLAGLCGTVVWRVCHTCLLHERQFPPSAAAAPTPCPSVVVSLVSGAAVVTAPLLYLSWLVVVVAWLAGPAVACSCVGRPSVLSLVAPSLELRLLSARLSLPMMCSVGWTAAVLDCGRSVACSPVQRSNHTPLRSNP